MKDYLKIGAMVAVLIAVAFAVEYSFSAKKGKSGNINIEIAYSPAFGEAGAPPANWTVYDIVSDKLGINLSLTALPSKAAEQDKIILAAAKNDSLPDFFTVSGTALNQLIEMDMVSPVDDM